MHSSVFISLLENLFNGPVLSNLAQMYLTAEEQSGSGILFRMKYTFSALGSRSVVCVSMLLFLKGTEGTWADSRNVCIMTLDAPNIFNYF
jgi:hypothetical protein